MSYKYFSNLSAYDLINYVKGKVNAAIQQVKVYFSNVVSAIREYIFPSKYCKNFMTHIVCGTNMKYVEEMIKIGGELIQNPVFTDNEQENYKKCLGFLWFICSKLHQDDVFIRGAIQFSDEPNITKIMEEIYKMSSVRTSSHHNGKKIKEAGFDENKDYNLIWPFEKKKTLLIIQRQDQKYYIKFEENSASISKPIELIGHTWDYFLSMSTFGSRTEDLEDRREQDKRKNEYTYGISEGNEVEFYFNYEYIFSNLTDRDLETIVEKWNRDNKEVEFGSKSIEEKLNRNDRNTKTFLSNKDFQTIKKLCENDLDLTDKLLIPGYNEFKNYNPTTKELIRKGLKNEKMNHKEWALLKNLSIDNYALSKKIKSLNPVNLEGVNFPLKLLEHDSDINYVKELIGKGENFLKKADEQLTITEEDTQEFIWFIFSRMSDDDIFSDGMIELTPDIRFKVILDQLIQQGHRLRFPSKHYQQNTSGKPIKLEESYYDLEGLPFGKNNVLFLKLDNGNYGIKIDYHSRALRTNISRGVRFVQEKFSNLVMGTVQETKGKDNLPTRREYEASGPYKFNYKYEYIFENFNKEDLQLIREELDKRNQLELVEKMDMDRKLKKCITEEEFNIIVDVCDEKKLDDAKLYVPNSDNFSKNKDLLKKAFLGKEPLSEAEDKILVELNHVYINYCKVARRTFVKKHIDALSLEERSSLSKIYSPDKMDKHLEQLENRIEERKFGEKPPLTRALGL